MILSGFLREGLNWDRCIKEDCPSLVCTIRALLSHVSEDGGMNQ